MMLVSLSGSWIRKFGAICALLLNATVSGASAQQVTSEEDKESEEVIFIPPATGAPADRVGAATRDVSHEGSILTLLAPEGGGVTTHAQPPLVWYLSENFAGEIFSQITRVDAPHIGVLKTTTNRFRKGFYALDLARSEFRLELGTIYEWSVVLTDAKSSAVSDQKTTYVEAIRTTSEIASKDVQELAREGLWFDALANFVEISLSGRVRVDESEGFVGLTSSANISLSTDLWPVEALPHED